LAERDKIWTSDAKVSGCGQALKGKYSFAGLL
jgi:hypothetical protein